MNEPKMAWSVDWMTKEMKEFLEIALDSYAVDLYGNLDTEVYATAEQREGWKKEQELIKMMRRNIKMIPTKEVK